METHTRTLSGTERHRAQEDKRESTSGLRRYGQNNRVLENTHAISFIIADHSIICQAWLALKNDFSIIEIYTKANPMQVQKKSRWQPAIYGNNRTSFACIRNGEIST
jgi:hypothetical protein